ncbi:hypothetical protein EV643_103456 [Kribbella sp. VKM Ac-2527]|uniref:Uncharacterized protein n=1 Tax=Kribbella caucasensis TaxID=2512215 RepID=A0A4R6KK63_9ACTN|nr:hypothetical protein EV643_103456 [Kribbella sp. VKM Ac-2527]
MALADRHPDTMAHAVDPGWVPTRMGGPRRRTASTKVTEPRNGSRPPTSPRSARGSAQTGTTAHLVDRTPLPGTRGSSRTSFTGSRNTLASASPPDAKGGSGWEVARVERCGSSSSRWGIARDVINAPITGLALLSARAGWMRQCAGAPLAFPVAYYIDGAIFPFSRNHFERAASLTDGGHPEPSGHGPAPLPRAVTAIALVLLLVFRWLTRVIVAGRASATAHQPGRCPLHTRGWLRGPTVRPES